MIPMIVGNIRDPVVAVARKSGNSWAALSPSVHLRHIEDCFAFHQSCLLSRSEPDRVCSVVVGSLLMQVRVSSTKSSVPYELSVGSLGH